MQCRHVQMKFPAYIDGDMRPGERREVEEHLEECEPCLEELRAVQQLLEECRGILAGATPSYTFEMLRRRMAGVRPLDEVAAFLPRLRINHAVPRLTVAALFLLLFMVGNLPVRQMRTMYHAMQRPFNTRADQCEPEYLDRLDVQYREQFASVDKTDSALPSAAKNEGREWTKWA